MSLPYAKLACSILDSSVWYEDDATLRVWITLLAMKDKNGIVNASIIGLAGRARKTIPETETALAKFMSPDPFSRTPDYEGRRVESVPGGWLVLNHQLYRDLMAPEEKREYERIKKANQRARKKIMDVPKCPGQPGQSRMSPHTKTEANTEIKEKGIRPANDSDFLKMLTQNQAYQGIDISVELGKMMTWCAVNRKHPSQRRFVNWLNHAERPMTDSINGNANNEHPSGRPIWKIRGDLEAKEKALVGVRRTLGQSLNADNKWEPPLTGGEKVRIDNLKTQIQTLRLELETAPV